MIALVRMQLLSLLFAALPLFTFAQQDTGKVVTHYKGGEINESYYRDAGGNKNGPYVRYTRYGKVYISGEYKDGMPVGTWSYYTSDTSGLLVEKLDFSTHRALYVDSLRVHSLICGPRYFGGNMLKQEYIQQHIKTDFSEAEKQQYKGKSFSVVFTIDSVTLKPIGVLCEDPTVPATMRKKMETIVSGMPAWLPPVCKGRDTVWRYSVVFVF